MNVFDAIIEILKRESVEFLSCYPTTNIIESAAAASLRPIICRQERVGVGIADGFSRVTNGRRLGVFAMQFGPGTENAFSGVATAYSDSTPILLLPWGHDTYRAGLPPYFSSVTGYTPVTKHVEQINMPGRVAEIMRRAFSLLRMGRLGPVMLETPKDVSGQTVERLDYEPVKTTRAAADPRDVDEAVRVLLAARHPVIHAGQGVLYAEAWPELLEFAELTQVPVVTTLLAKSVFPEDHPLSLGVGYRAMTGTSFHYLKKADVLFGIGCSFSRHHQSAVIPAGKTIIHATNCEADINREYYADHPVIGDAKPVLRQFIEAARERLGKQDRTADGEVTAEIRRVKEKWLAEWMPKLTSDETPLNPYRIIWELMHTIDPAQTIITHDSGSPRDQLAPFYQSTVPRGYLGWGKSHGLGTGLGLIMGAKLASPEKIAINIMGDAAFGMVGLDFETAVRNKIPIITMVFNNFGLAVNTEGMPISHERYRSRDTIGNYAEMGRAMGGYAERVENPAEIVPAIRRAVKVTREEERPVLLEFITRQEISYSLIQAL